MEYSSVIKLPFSDKRGVPRLRDGNTEKPGYRYGWRLFTQVADTMGVELQEEDVERWRAMFGITRALDNMVDEEGCEDIEPALVTLLSGRPVGQVGESEALEFRALIATYSTIEQQHLVDKIKKLAAFAKEKAETPSFKELVVLTRNEAEWYSSLFKLKESSSKDAENRQRFNDWLRDFMAAGYMFDSLIDMEEDFSNGNISVVPSLKNKKALTGVATREIIKSVNKTPLRRLGSIAYIAYRNVHPPKTTA